MKIAHFPGSFLPQIGGAEIIVHNLALEQAKNGHLVHVIAPRSSKVFFKKHYINIPYKIISPIQKSFEITEKLSSYKLSIDWLLIKQIEYFQKKYKYDLWHFNLIGPNALKIVPVLKKMGILTIGTFRGGDIQWYPEIDYGLRKEKSFDNSVKNTIHLFDCLTAISKTVELEYIKLGVNKKNIKLIPNFINLSRYNDLENNKNFSREYFNWPNDKKIILTVGRNHIKKGYMYIPDIIKSIVKYRDDFLWVIVGKGCKEIINKAKILGVNSYLRIKEEVGVVVGQNKLIDIPSTELIMMYYNADVFCFPTIVETFGNVFLEAMATGLPVVTTNAPGARDIIIHKYNGLVSDVYDVNQMAENIKELLKDKKLEKRLIKNGLNEIKKYSITRILKKYQNVYNETLTKKHSEITV